MSSVSLCPAGPIFIMELYEAIMIVGFIGFLLGVYMWILFDNLDRVFSSESSEPDFTKLRDEAHRSSWIFMIGGGLVFFFGFVSYIISRNRIPLQ